MSYVAAVSVFLSLAIVVGLAGCVRYWQIVQRTHDEWPRRCYYICDISGRNVVGVVPATAYDEWSRARQGSLKRSGLARGTLCLDRPILHPVYVFMGHDAYRLLQSVSSRRGLYLEYREFFVPESFVAKGPDEFMADTAEFEPKAA